MNPVAFLIATLILTLPLQAGESTIAAPTDAAQLLTQVVGNLPRQPLDLYGHIVTRKRRGVVVQKMGFQMKLRWGDSPPTATYTLTTPEGVHMETLVQTLENDEPTLSFFTGGKRLKAPVPDLQQRIHGTDFSWADLSLSFLWWTPGATVESDSFKGRDCQVIEVRSPPSGGGNTGTQPLYSRVRLWIDNTAGMLLKAQARDHDDQEVRSLWVWSVKKIGETWMIKDLEVKDVSTQTRTSIIVDRVLLDGQEYKTE